MKLKLSAILIVLFILPLVGCAQQNSENSMSISELKQAMQTDSTIVLLDVRTPAELTGPLGKIETAINIPLQELNSRVKELNKYKNNPIAVICRSGNRSEVATKFLLERGFKAKNVLGGMRAYNAE